MQIKSQPTRPETFITENVIRFPIQYLLYIRDYIIWRDLLSNLYILLYIEKYFL